MSANYSNTLGNGIHRPSSRPMETVVDGQGNYWICDRGVDKDGDLSAQGCVHFDDMPLKPED